MLLEIKGVQKSFRNHNALKDVSFGMEKGEIMAVIGHSGAGKTTLLRCINALETCDRGSIRIDGIYLCKEENGKMVNAAADNMKLIRRKLGMVFQNLNLFPHKSVLENIIEAPVNVYNMPKEEVIGRAYELLEQLGIRDKADCYPYQLSGGQRQRVAIARACALNPSIMCFDEPTSALDPELRESIACIIEKLASEGMAILIITHDMCFAQRVAGKLIFMEAGEIAQMGKTEELLTNPRDERIRKFVNSA